MICYLLSANLYQNRRINNSDFVFELQLIIKRVKSNWRTVIHYPKSYPKIQRYSVKANGIMLDDFNRRWSTDKYINNNSLEKSFEISEKSVCYE